MVSGIVALRCPRVSVLVLRPFDNQRHIFVGDVDFHSGIHVTQWVPLVFVMGHGRVYHSQHLGIVSGEARWRGFFRFICRGAIA